MNVPTPTPLVEMCILREWAWVCVVERPGAEHSTTPATSSSRVWGDCVVSEAYPVPQGRML